ncbi:MAG: choice-of-anchor D domain-containing protein, partial [Saprospiraceae bacterium]|nr:choice-of-anchor D domain-containing protein [Saprospiraceae bacterium]
SGTSISVGAGPRSVAIGDFNEDGVQDLAVSGAGVFIRLGNGDGTFSGSLNVTVGSSPYSIAIGDFNGDGHQDFATSSNSPSGPVSIRVGDGAGGFSGSTSISMGTNTLFVAVGDFNADGAQDFVTANFNADNAGVRLGLIAEINLKGNAVNIADGDNAPIPGDHTDFGSTLVSAGMVSRTFTIENAGLANLTIPAAGITLGGAHAADFMVSGISLPAVIAPSGSATFMVSFDPSAGGLRTATVNIANNDCNENPYDFAIQGLGQVPQAITVLGNGNAIANRSTTVSATDHTDFGGVAVAGGMTPRVFTIENISGGFPLQLDGVPLVEVAGRDQGDFSVTVQPASAIAGGSSATFNVKFDPSAPGIRSAVLVITHNDLPENPFVFRVEGLGN